MNPVASSAAFDTTRLEGESKLVVRSAALGASSQEPRKYTIDDAFDNMGFGKTQLLMFFFCGMAWAGDGMEMMLLSYLGPAVRPSLPLTISTQAPGTSCLTPCVPVQLRCKWDLSPAQESWISSSVFLGMMFGSFVWGSLSDTYGRRVGFFAPACFTAVFGVLSAVAPNYPVRLAALLSGLLCPRLLHRCAACVLRAVAPGVARSAL